MSLINQLFNYATEYRQSVSVWGYEHCELLVPIDKYEVGQVIDYIEIDYDTSELIVYDIHDEVESRHILLITLK